MATFDQNNINQNEDFAQSQNVDQVQQQIDQAFSDEQFSPQSQTKGDAFSQGQMNEAELKRLSEEYRKKEQEEIEKANQLSNEELKQELERTLDNIDSRLSQLDAQYSQQRAQQRKR